VSDRVMSDRECSRKGLHVFSMPVQRECPTPSSEGVGQATAVLRRNS
jgi:hypothetical protein